MKTQQGVFMMIMILFLAGSAGCAQKVTVSPGNTGDLAQRWEWAVREARQYSGGVWIGYGIERLMSENSFIGNHSNQETGQTTLKEIITGTTGATVRLSPGAQDSVEQTAERALLNKQPLDQAEPKVLKKVALLFYFPGNPAEITHAADMKLSNLSLPVNLDDRPLLWLGMTGQKESIAFLSQSFQRTDSETVRKDLIVAIGMHQVSSEVIPFLSGVIHSDAGDDLRADAVFWLGQQADEQVTDLLVRTVNNDKSVKVRKRAVFALSLRHSQKAVDALLSLARKGEDNPVREEAVFWLGQADDPRVVGMLIDIAKNDPSIEVRKKALFALHQQGSEQAVDALIDLARHASDREVRKQAIFWLGQIASDSVAGELKDLTYQEPETEIQEQAVFAISQLPDRSGVPLLIDIVRNHPNASVRKKAIFWLGQSNDPRAREELVKIVKGEG